MAQRQATGVTVTFRNLSLDVINNAVAGKKKRRMPWEPKEKKMKRILSGVSGEIYPGDLVALIGASGAGKSTLLNVLAGRNRRNEGEVLFNDVPMKDTNILDSNSCFVQQEDMFYGSISVLEHLQYQAKLRIPMKSDARAERVEEVISLFGLGKAKHNLIGNIAMGEKRGISGGEKKRLSVATELLTCPSLVFADEPTSGLDAFMAEGVVEVLSNLAANGHSVISTIHQPSSDVFERFNKLLLLSEGRVVYFGQREAAITYFTRLGRPIPPFTNPADFFVEILAIDWENASEQLETLNNLAQHWRDEGAEFNKLWAEQLGSQLADKRRSLQDVFTKKLSSRLSVEGDLVVKPPSVAPVKKPFEIELDEDGNLKSVPYGARVSAIASRMMLNTTRNPTLMWMRIFLSATIAALSGFLYFRLPNEDWYSKSGAAYFTTLQCCWQNAANAAMSLIQQKPLFLREKEAGLYSSWTFFMSQCICDIPLTILLATIFTTLCWWMMGLNDSASAFFLGLGFNILTALSATSIGYIASAIAPTAASANALFPTITVLMLLVTPFSIDTESLHAFWLWLFYISPFVHGWMGFMVAVFDGVDFNIENCVSTPINFCNGEDVLRHYSIYASDAWLYAMLLIVIAVVGRILAAVFLWLTSRKKQNE